MMAKTTEQKMVLSAPDGAKITKADLKIVDEGKTIEIVITTEVVTVNTEDFDAVFPIIDPSELIGNILLTHKPKTERQEWLMRHILKALELKLPAFRAPCMDPSEENGRIVFKPGNKPAVGHNALWWREKWKEFMPSKNSRLGTELHRAAFLGILMKDLIETRNYTMEEAWKAVCDDSHNLGHYCNSWRAKNTFEPTGSRMVGKFFDLSNTNKIFASSEGDGFWIASACCFYNSKFAPLSEIKPIIINPYGAYGDCVGWGVMDV